MRTTRTPIALVLGVALVGPAPARAQVALVQGTPGQAPAPAEVKAIPITLRPAAEPVPALRYRLLPERRDLAPGNAAIFYHRAIQLLLEKRLQAATGPRPAAPPAEGQRTPAPEEKLAAWGTEPLEALPRAEAQALLATYASVLHEVELGAARVECDWDFDQRREGISLLIPEVQEMRSLARLVAVQARLAILDGATAEAMRWIQIGMVLGRHVAHGPTLIQALVGVAIDSVMLKAVEDLIQAPGTPSLYWALADAPRPFIDFRYPFEGERYLLEKELPQLSELEDGVWSAERARRFGDELQRKLLNLASGEPVPGTHTAVPNDLGSFGRRFAIMALITKLHPEAKRALIAGGRPADQIQAMPVVQAVCLHSVLEYQRLRDHTYKWLNQPYWLSYQKVDAQMTMTPEQKLANPLLTLFLMLTPALNSARVASVRIDRHLDALQCIEAIRIHAAAHEGKFPERLDDLNAETPVPIDPATGQPFEYRVEGDTATLAGPIIPGFNHPSFGLKYVLKRAD